MKKLDKNFDQVGQKMTKWDKNCNHVGQNYEQVGQKISPSRTKIVTKLDKTCHQVGQ